MMFAPQGSPQSVSWLSGDAQLWFKTMWQNPQRQLQKPPDVRHLPPATHLPRSCQLCTCCQTLLPSAPNCVYLCCLPASSWICWRFICITCLVCFLQRICSGTMSQFYVCFLLSVCLFCICLWTPVEYFAICFFLLTLPSSVRITNPIGGIDSPFKFWHVTSWLPLLLACLPFSFSSSFLHTYM